jgi:polysaccharide pyruvyl transferase WcaK-like protein
MEDLAFYMHAGSGNHGCEAIVESLAGMLKGQRFTLMTNSRQEDLSYFPENVKKQADIIEEKHMNDHFLTHAAYYAYRKVTGDQESFLRYRYSPLTKEKPRLAVSIGGDNYCYPEMVGDLMLANSMFQRQGTRTMLLGCSIEPELLKKDAKIREDLARYDRILARESITYEALLSCGIPKEKVRLVPDPAFCLPKSEDRLPADFKSGNTVGINLSPMALDYATDREAAFNGYVQLIRHILAKTDMDVALVPHVVWARSCDLVPLRKLAAAFSDEKRVRLIDDMPAQDLKGIIANCAFFVGARTHATIAAYSSLVPTLVIGYSVKARGIAKDLFRGGESFVLPVQAIRDPSQVIEAFDHLMACEDAIHFDLAGAIPLFMNRARENGEEILSLLKD